MLNVKEASSILKVGFGLSKRPHFHRAYLVRVPFLTGIAVFPPQLIQSARSMYEYVKERGLETLRKSTQLTYINGPTQSVLCLFRPPRRLE